MIHHRFLFLCTDKVLTFSSILSIRIIILLLNSFTVIINIGRPRNFLNFWREIIILLLHLLIMLIYLLLLPELLLGARFEKLILDLKSAVPASSRTRSATSLFISVRFLRFRLILDV